jgi:hypothetical protein
LATFGFMLLGLLLLASSVVVGVLALSFTLEEAFGPGPNRDIGTAIIGGVIAVTLFVLAIVSLAQAADTRAARSARAARAHARPHGATPPEDQRAEPTDLGSRVSPRPRDHPDPQDRDHEEEKRRRVATDG